VLDFHHRKIDCALRNLSLLRRNIFSQYEKNNFALRNISVSC